MVSYVSTFINNKINNASYYSIKLLLDSSNTFNNNFKNIESTQLLSSFLSMALVSNLPFDNNKSIHSFRNLMLKLAGFKDPKSVVLPIFSSSCVTHDTSIKCSEYHYNTFLNNLQMLSSLYSKVGILQIIASQSIDVKLFLKNVCRSTLFLSIYAYITTGVWCYLQNINENNSLMDLQLGSLLGSFAFYIEDAPRKKILNRYMFMIYINTIIKQLHIDNKKIWNIILIFSILISLKKRGFTKTCLSMIF